MSDKPSKNFLEGITKQDLRILAKGLHLTGFAVFGKDDLVSLIEKSNIDVETILQEMNVLGIRSSKELDARPTKPFDLRDEQVIPPRPEPARAEFTGTPVQVGDTVVIVIPSHLVASGWLDPVKEYRVILEYLE